MRMVAQGQIALLEQILYGHQGLPSAACRNEWSVFDAVAESSELQPRMAAAAYKAAAAICGTCIETTCRDRLQAGEAPGNAA